MPWSKCKYDFSSCPAQCSVPHKSFVSAGITQAPSLIKKSNLPTRHKRWQNQVAAATTAAATVSCKSRPSNTGSPPEKEALALTLVICLFVGCITELKETFNYIAIFWGMCIKSQRIMKSQIRTEKKNVWTLFCLFFFLILLVLPWSDLLIMIFGKTCRLKV